LIVRKMKINHLLTLLNNKLNSKALYMLDALYNILCEEERKSKFEASFLLKGFTFEKTIFALAC
jgi:hypothetical protein